MSNMDVGSNLQWSTTSTMNSQHHFYSIVTQSCQNMSQLCQCNCVKVNLYAYISYWKVLKHLICPVWMWDAIKGGLQPQQWHHDIIFTWLSPTIANICPIFVSVTVAMKPFKYAQYGCGKQSAVVYSLNYDIMASFPMNNHHELPTSDVGSLRS